MTCGSKEQKETVMVLKVDLECERCYKKVKKVLCKFPQIRNQVYDEKNNTVTITVLCCSPEKIREKLCCKAGKSIKSIEIKQQPKPEPKPKPAPPEKPKPAPPEKPKPLARPAPDTAKADGKPDYPSPDEAVSKPPRKRAERAAAPMPQEPEAQWVPGYPPGPPPQMLPVSACCAPCYEGRPGGPCYHTGPPAAPYPYGYCGRPCPPSYYGNRCDYFSEENPSACSIM